jgi:hypothetical protein
MDRWRKIGAVDSLLLKAHGDDAAALVRDPSVVGAVLALLDAHALRPELSNEDRIVTQRARAAVLVELQRALHEDEQEP